MQVPNPHPAADESVGAGPQKLKLRDVYVRKTGRRERQDIWIVGGLTVRPDIFDEFLQGGNAQRFRFVPQNEIWIDGSTSVEEYTFSGAWTICRDVAELRLRCARR